MRFKTILLLLLIIIVGLSASSLTNKNVVPKESHLKPVSNKTVASDDSPSNPNTASSSSDSGTSTSNDKTDTDVMNNTDTTISRTTLNDIIASMVNSSTINASISYSSSSSPPKTLIEYPYQSADQYEIDKLAGKITANTVLHTLPKKLTYSYLERQPPPPPPTPSFETISYTTKSNRHIKKRISVSSSSYMSISTLTPQEQAQAKLADLTNTELKCYVAPPTNVSISLEDMMGFWYVVRKVNDSRGTDYKYICEEIVYTLTSPTTFNKTADVHFRGKWMTVHGNGTFIPPGIVIIDWVVLDDPSEPNRLVFTVLGANYNQWVVGYDCLTGKLRPEVVLQTRHKRVRAKYLHQAYRLIHSKKLPLDDMVCETGFKTSVFSKSNSHKSHAQQR